MDNMSITKPIHRFLPVPLTTDEKVDYDAFNDNWHVAECSCGWNGPERSTQAEALKDLAVHYDAAEGRTP